MTRHVFEIRKAGFENKGAAMMLIATARRLKARYPDAILSVPVDHTHPFEPRARLGLWHRAELIRKGIDFGRMVEGVPQKLRRRYGFITSAEVDVVIDAAGLAYTDQWGPAATCDLARRAKEWKAAGKKLILLPQAFGPFTSPDIREAINMVADRADLIFARDPVSLKHLTDTVGARDTIRLGPDFTNLLSGEPTDLELPGPSTVAIVPNARMLDKTDKDAAASYPNFLAACVTELRAHGHMPVMLVHEGAADLAIAKDVAARFDPFVPILQPEDALQAKTLIGRCDGIIASRYHALISALSQGIPAIGTGWSHKYSALFADYGQDAALVEITDDPAALAMALAPLTDPARRAAFAEDLVGPAKSIKTQSEAVWEGVFAVIDG